MNMNAPAVPSASPAVPVASAASNASASTSNDVEAGDFLIMLGQLLGAPVPQATGTGKSVTATLSDRDGDAKDAAQDAAALMGVPMPVIAQIPLAPSPDGEVQLLPIAIKTNDAASMRSELDLPAELMNGKGNDDGSGFPANMNASLQTLDGAQQLRSAAVADAATSRPVQHPVGSSAWANEIGTRMIMMTERGQHSASLRLSPEHLGPLEVRIA